MRRTLLVREDSEANHHLSRRTLLSFLARFAGMHLDIGYQNFHTEAALLFHFHLVRAALCPRILVFNVGLLAT